MPKRLFHRLGRFFQKPIFGTQVIPSNARLDLDTLPEEEFPLYCEKCGYLLRGLPSDRCPECGTDFDRHHLILKHYVHKWFDGLVRTTRVGRVIRWSCFGGLALVVLNLLGMLAVGWGGYRVLLLPTRPSSASVLTKGVWLLWVVERAIWITEGVLLVCILVGFVWAAKEIGRRLRQRRQVVDAILEPIGTDSE